MTKEGYFAGGRIINQRHISSVLWAPTCPARDLSTHTTFTSSQTCNITCLRFPWKLNRKVNIPLAYNTYHDWKKIIKCMCLICLFVIVSDMCVCVWFVCLRMCLICVFVSDMCICVCVCYVCLRLICVFHVLPVTGRWLALADGSAQFFTPPNIRNANVSFRLKPHFSQK